MNKAKIRQRTKPQIDLNQNTQKSRANTQEKACFQTKIFLLK